MPWKQSSLILFFVISQFAANEVFVFLLKTTPEVWMRLDWQKISVVCLAGWVDANLIDFAHAHESKVNLLTKPHQSFFYCQRSSSFQIFLKLNFLTQQLKNTGYNSKWILQSSTSWMA